jgi:hypothetical protein
MRRGAKSLVEAEQSSTNHIERDKRNCASQVVSSLRVALALSTTTTFFVKDESC